MSSTQGNEWLLPKPEPQLPAMDPTAVPSRGSGHSIARDFQQRTFWYEIICFVKAGKSATFATNNSGAKHNTSVVRTGCQLTLCPLATCWQEGGALPDEALNEPGTLLLGGAARFWIRLVPVLF